MIVPTSDHQIHSDYAFLHATKGNNMKILFFLLAVTASFYAKGQIPFDLEPSQPPVYTSESGKKYWECEGLVESALLEVTAGEMVMLSNHHGLQAPNTNLCLYSISSNILNRNVKMYAVDYYVSVDSMETCLLENYCDNFRTVNFVAIGGGIKRQYLLSSVDSGTTEMACIDWSGRVSNPAGGCAE